VVTSLRRVGINIISGGAGYILPMALNVVAAPFILKHLGEEAYGLQILANVIIGYFVVADMGLDIPITHRVAEYNAKQDTELLTRFISATLKLYFIIGLTGAVLLIILTDQFIEWLSIPISLNEEAHTVFYLSAIGFFGSIINMWGKAVFNGFHRYDVSNGISIVNNILSIVIGIFMILCGYGLVGFFIVRVVGFLLSSMTYIIMTLKMIRSFSFLPIIDRVIWAALKKQIGYGFSLRLSGMIFARMDQTLISAWVGISAVATYSFPILIASTLSGLIASLSHFAFPMVSSMSATNSKSAIESFFLKITKLIVCVSTLIFIPFIICGDIFLTLWINPIVSSQNQEVLFFLTVAFYINSCLTIGLNAVVVGSGQLKYFTFYGVGRGVCLFIGFLLLVKPFGINGAGYAYISTLLLDFGFTFYTIKSKLNFDLKQVILVGYVKPILIGFVLGFIMLLVKTWITTWTELIGIVTAYWIVYFILGYLIGLVDEKEKILIKSLLKKIMNLW